MKSMTGYGRAVSELSGYTLTIQISAVNRKTLDLAVKLPGVWETLEAPVAEQVRQVVLRGRIMVSVELTGAKGASVLAWDEAAIGLTLDRLKALAAGRGHAFEPTPELLWSVAQSQRTETALPAPEAAEPVLKATLAEALTAFVAMRTKEGDALLADFLERLALLRTQVALITARAPLVPAGYREVFFKRLREAGLELDLADERVLKEVALFADRCDVTEELTRLKSHFEQFETLLKSKGEIGRKAEFILQEIGREVNTIGSKANDLTISRAVIELKNELERVREQIANVE